MHIAGYFSNIIAGFPDLLVSGGYWILSIIVFLEGLPIIGSFFPGHIAIISAGFLARLGILNLAIVIIISIITSALGDAIGFLIGKRMGYAFLQKWSKYVFLKEYHIEKARKIIDNHTGKSIILGKFSPITRPLVPFIVGASGIHIKKFWPYNILGVALWVTASVMIGYIFGASYSLGAEYMGQFIFIALILSIFIIWGYRFVNLHFHIFKKYEIFILFLNIISLWALARAIQDSLSVNSFMKNFDIWLNIIMGEYINPLCVNIASWISMLGDTRVMVFLGIIIGLFFLYKDKWRRGIIMLFSILSTSFVVIFMKDIILRSRPDNALQILSDPSFPSGHAALSAAFFLSLAYVFAPRIESWMKRELLIVICVIAPILIGISRVILNVHWASDVIAGWSVGIFLSSGGILLIRYFGSIFVKKESLIHTPNNGSK